MCWITGVRMTDVLQPNIVWTEMGTSATINCSHTKDAAYNQMYWYHQHQGETMKLIVFTASYNTKPEFGNEFNEQKFSTNKTVPESGSITVKNLDSTDSAVYFCMVKQHCVIALEKRCTKTSLHVRCG
ncbi:hypothetical protein P4O66_011609 [Electrophorus voltai]|uniref:Ig-like domain-containing protein n=1 Tax=Electrophorus voltai TaxID=2609070 RepID=A0AAD8Z664_9TELE|nr:hypothetical protein P4O66_011609 [Electrophorus voltai]